MHSPEELALIAAIADDLAAGVWVATVPEGRFVYANRAFHEIMGMGPVPEAAAGEYTSNYGIFGRDGLPYPEHRLPFAQALASRSAVVVDDIVIHQRSGARVYVRAQGKPMCGSDGRITHIAIAFFDITREVVAEEARAHSEAKLVAADRLASLGSLAAGVAHEVNGPLSYVIGNVDLAIERLERAMGSRETIDLLRDGRQGAERVRAIVRDLKLFSHREEERCDVVDVRGPLEVAIKMARNEVRHRAVLTTHLTEVRPVWADEGRLAQVFLNILINAAHAIPEGHANEHAVTVSTGAFHEGDADWVEVVFSDSGAGMSSEVVAKIFEPFFTTKPVGVGTGLGLAISHVIITSFGGRIRVESREEKGSTFRVQLPATSLTKKTVALSPRKTPVRVERLRVLVVDDDALILKVIRAILLEDHDVTSESRASEAFARIERGERFDVILCDLMMPFMTGMELHLRVSQVAPDQAARMIFLTGGAFTERARKFIENTKNTLLEKPFDGPELLRTIADHTH